MYTTAAGRQLLLSGATTHVMPSHVAGSSVAGTSGNDLFYASAGDRMAGGGGDDRYEVWSPSFTITEAAGGGTDTLYSHVWGAVVLPDNVENLFLMDQGSTSGTGNALDNIIAAGTVGAWLDGGQGNDVLVGGGGRDVFQVKAGNGSDAIEQFTHGSDVVRLEGYGITSFANLMAHASQVGADVSFALPNGEALVMRDTQISALDATDFRLSNNVAGTLPADAFSAPAAGSGLSHMVGPAQCYTADGWYVLNNAWGSGNLTYGSGYKLTDTYHAGDLTAGTTFDWSYPVIATSPNASPTILAYPEVIFGGSPYGTGYDATDTHNVFPVQLSSLTSLKANYDVSFGGDTRGYDVAYDIFLTNHPHGLVADMSNEVMIWLHQGDFKVYGDVVGTYQDGDFAATIYHQPGTTYTAVVANSDAPVGNLDITKIFAKLETLGIISQNEYLADVELGAEVVSGQGSLTVNHLDLTVQSANSDGTTTTKVVTGHGTTESTSMPVVTPPVVTPPVDPTIHGTAGDDVLTGDATNNIIYGDAGNDHIDGGLGADAMHGGLGDDTYVVDNPGDTIVEASAEGSDLVLSSIGYALGDNVDNLTLTGGGEIDGKGNALDNVITGNDAANHLDGGAGADTLIGGSGDDSYLVDDARDVVTEAVGGGNDTVIASASYVLAKGQEIETLKLANPAGTEAYSLSGNEFANTLVGNAGANVLNGGTGADVMKGGAGDDIYIVDNAGDSVFEAPSGGTDRVWADVNYALSPGQAVEFLQTHYANATTAINLTGNELNNTIFGNAGNNILNGGAGDDVMAGGRGDDTYIVDSSHDFVKEVVGEGNDTVIASTSYALAGGQEIETLRLADPAATNALNLTGNEFANTLIGNAGANTLNGGAGADVMQGNAGNDIYIVDNADDTVLESASGGTDRVWADISYTLAPGQEIEFLQTHYASANTPINLTGNELNNTIFGNAGNNVLDGGAGNDVLSGGGGADTLIGGAGNDIFIVDANDTVQEGVGGGKDSVLADTSYTLATGQEIENLSVHDAGSTASFSLIGNEFNNTIVGCAGNDVLDGGAGDDTLRGGAGADQLTGGLGADTFAFRNGDTGATATMADTILDFSQLQGDRVDLSGIDANTAVAGDQAFKLVSSDEDHVAGSLWLTNGAGFTDMNMDVNGDGKVDYLVHVMNPTGAQISAADFIY